MLRLCSSLSKYILVLFWLPARWDPVSPGSHHQSAICSVESVDNCSFYICDLLEIKSVYRVYTQYGNEEEEVYGNDNVFNKLN